MAHTIGKLERPTTLVCLVAEIYFLYSRGFAPFSGLINLSCDTFWLLHATDQITPMHQYANKVHSKILLGMAKGMVDNTTYPMYGKIYLATK